MGYGRPSKLTPERQKRAIEILQIGGTRRLASARAGITQRTFERWLKRSTPAYVAFVEAVERAETEAEALLVGKMQEAAIGGAVLSRETIEQVNAKGEVIKRVTRETYAPPDGRLALDIQARRHPEEWARRDAVDINLKTTLQSIADELGVPFHVVQAEAERQALGTGGFKALPGGRNGAG